MKPTLPGEPPRFEVLKKDYGIRPAGLSDECFFCNQKVGQFHEVDCVVIVRSIVFDVYYDEEELPFGTYRTAKPATWTDDQCLFSVNDGSWCASNMLTNEDSIGLQFQGDHARLEKILQKSCGCNVLTLKIAERSSVVRRARI